MKETFGQKITRLRKSKGLTQEDIAKNITISPQAVSKWENDISTPDIYITKKLASILGVSVDDLLDEEKELNIKGEARAEELKDDEVEVLPPGVTRDEDGDIDVDEDIVYKDDKHYQKWSLLTNILEPVCAGLGIVAYVVWALISQYLLDDGYPWAYGWTFILFGLTIGSIFICIKDRKFTRFTFPLLVVGAYCLLGFMGSRYGFPGWQVFWFLFLLIPLFYIIFGRIDSYNENKRLNLKNKKVK